MSFVTVQHLHDPGADSPSFPESSVVETLRAIETDDGATVPAGSHGTVVAVYGQGRAYEVEFARPVVGTCTVAADGLRAA